MSLVWAIPLAVLVVALVGMFLLDAPDVDIRSPVEANSTSDDDGNDGGDAMTDAPHDIDEALSALGIDIDELPGFDATATRERTDVSQHSAEGAGCDRSLG